MPKLEKRLTDTFARKLEVPASGYELFWCADDPGFGCRVTSSGARSWIAERRVDGKTVRRTLGKVIGSSAISSEAARKLKISVSSELQQGVDRLADKRQAAQQAKVEAVTLEQALRAYVLGKRRAKDGLPLKDRTKSDYLAMLEAGSMRRDKTMTLPGELHDLANKSIYKITGNDIRDLYKSLSARSERRATYAMQVLRATLNWHGVTVALNPLGKDVAGRDRIVLRPTTGQPKPIAPEYLGAWWRAACDSGSERVGGGKLGGDYYRFRLLTGVRGVEVLGDAFGNEPVRVRDVDLVSARLVLPNTKNRSNHTLLLSRQALEIVSRNVEGKKPADPIFAIGDPRKTLQAINRAAGMESLACQGHDLRATFASVAEELVSQYCLKRMMNHADGGDVTGAHYIGKSESQLRAGWQAVADFIEAQGATV